MRWSDTSLGTGRRTGEAGKKRDIAGSAPLVTERLQDPATRPVVHEKSRVQRAKGAESEGCRERKVLFF